MNDQQRTETAADNCEVLRARLARYEDADGKPITTIAEQARDIESLNTRFGMACKDLAAIDAALDLPVRDYASTNREKLDAIAELKAQPGRVVHHNLIEALKFYANGDHLLLADPDAWDTCSGEPINFLHDDAGTASVEDGSIAKAALDSLNSSPVSDGNDAQYPPCDYCAEPLSYHPWHGSGLINGVESRHIHACDKCRHLLPSVSACGVDERAAFETWAVENHFGTRRPFANSNNYESGYTDFCWKAWQARAALSAPSHGEQVRDGWKLVPVEPTREMISAASGAITKPDDLPPVGVGGWSMSDLAFRSRYRAAIASAPSPSKQGDKA